MTPAQRLRVGIGFSSQNLCYIVLVSNFLHFISLSCIIVIHTESFVYVADIPGI